MTQTNASVNTLRRCKQCDQPREASQFVDQPTVGTEGKCLQCLPRNANGFSECVRCKTRKRANEFHHRPSGRRSRVCEACYPQHLKSRTCQQCNEDKPLERFPRTRQTDGTGKRRNICSDCYKPKLHSRICYRCRERVSVESFAVRPYHSTKLGRVRYRRDNYCQYCRDLEPTPQRQCCHCEQTKPIEEFRKILWGHRSRRCKACPVPYNHGKGGDLLRKLPEPCLQCHEDMWTFLPPSRTVEAKFCSRQCATAGKRPATRECNQCRATLPSSQFPERSCNKAHSLWRCNQCLQDIREGRTLARPGTCTPTSLMRQFRARAKRDGLQFKLRYREVRDLLLQTCCFCANDADTCALVDEGETVKAANLRPLCITCRHFIARRPLGETLRWVQAAAACNGWTGPPPPRSRKAAPKPKVANRLRRSDMVPAEVHGIQQMGEAWEDRVARHAKPKGPLGSKRKPDEELHA